MLPDLGCLAAGRHKAETAAVRLRRLVKWTDYFPLCATNFWVRTDAGVGC